MSAVHLRIFARAQPIGVHRNMPRQDITPVHHSMHSRTVRRWLGIELGSGIEP